MKKSCRFGSPEEVLAYLNGPVVKARLERLWKKCKAEGVPFPHPDRIIAALLENPDSEEIVVKRKNDVVVH